ncbi:MAG: hypothetical protein ACTSUE_21960, partial [Promethearchaeota archaeon]
MLRKLWFYPPWSDECIVGIDEAGGGDEYTCLGPVYVVRDGENHFVIDVTLDQRDLLAARDITIRARGGYLNMVPASVSVDMEMPKIHIETDCLYTSENAVTYTGDYITYHYDAYTNMITNVWMSFRREDTLTQHRLLLERKDTTGDNFRLVLATQTGTGTLEEYFQDTHKSFTVLNEVTPAKAINVCIYTLLTSGLIEFQIRDCDTVFENDDCVMTLPSPQAECIGYLVDFTAENSILYWTNNCDEILFDTGNYDPTLYDCIISLEATQTSPFNSWIDVLQFDVPYEMNDTSEAQDLGNCFLELSLVEAPLPPVLKDPFLVTDLNYFKNVMPFEKYVKRLCNAHHGGVDSDNRLRFAYCPERFKCGGEAVFKTKGIPGILLFVPPNPLYDAYRDDCDHAYPLAPEFLGFGLDGTGNPNAVYARMDADREICQAPLLIPEFVNDREGPGTVGFTEREIQCHLMGMELIRSGEICFRPIAWAKCKKGYVYFDQHCYYIIDVNLESRLKVIDSEADDICATVDPDLGDKVKSLRRATEYVSAFLQKHYVFINRPNPLDEDDLEIPAFRVPVKGRQCFQYTYEINDPADPTLDTPVVLPVHCEERNFPVCRYHVKHHEVEGTWERMHLETVRVLRDGQPDGVKHRGEDALCRCFNGWTGTNCDIPTCPVPIFSSTNLEQSANDDLSIFFFKCYNQNQGMCKDGQVRQCDCNPYYGPDASLLPSGFGLDDFKEFPCGCPASNEPNGGVFVINETVYETEWTQYLPCGGIDRGNCTVDSTTNTGRCNCKERIDLNPDSINLYELAYDGKACTSRRPVIPPDGFNNGIDIAETFCNLKGISGPHGEDGREEFVEGQDVSYLERQELRKFTNITINGCVCFNQFEGEACTCASPNDLADGRVVYTENFHAFVDLGDRHRIERVHVFAQLPGIFTGNRDCGVTFVAISDSTTLSNDNQITCSMMSSEGVTWYECPDAPFARYVHVYTAGEKHPKCLIQAFSTYFPACGDRHKTNPTSGAFFNHEFNRGPNKYEEPQSIQFAPKGCTNTACMCSIDYAGVLCNSGVSSIEMDLDGKLSKRVCRETMQPPGGSSKFSKDGTCECNSITTDDSTGIAGEVKGFFYGDSCACASLFVKSRNEHRSCAGHGQCVTPNFPWGRPIYDVNDFENDPLSNPFVRDLGNGVNNFRYTIVNREEDLSPNEDPRSVLSINGESWFFSEG